MKLTFLAGLVALAVICTNPSPTRAEVCGDHDGDGAIHVSDALRVLHAAVDLPSTLMCPAIFVCDGLAGGAESCLNDGTPDSPVTLTSLAPVIGEVATRGESWYRAVGLTPGVDYRVAVHGVVRPGEQRGLDARLHVFADDTYSFELDCTLREQRNDCDVTSDGGVYFSVRSGPLNRVGAPFIITLRER